MDIFHEDESNFRSGCDQRVVSARTTLSTGRASALLFSYLTVLFRATLANCGLGLFHRMRSGRRNCRMIQHLRFLERPLNSGPIHARRMCILIRARWNPERLDNVIHLWFTFIFKFVEKFLEVYDFIVTKMCPVFNPLVIKNSFNFIFLFF